MEVSQYFIEQQYSFDKKNKPKSQNLSQEIYVET